MGDSFLNLDDLADVFAQLDTIEETEVEMDEEALASKRRYDEIIKKHKDAN